MGLTLHYRLTAPEGCSARHAAALVRRLHAIARGWLAQGRVVEVDDIVAALAGAVKDATEGDGSAPVQSPIFAHPQFERLEAEGAANPAANLAAAAKIIAALPRNRDRT